MPQFHDPSPPKMGPGMVIGRGGVRGKRLKRKSSMNGGGTNDTSVIAAAQLANDDEFCFPTTSTKQNDSDKTTANKKRVHVFAESSDEEDSGKKQQQKKVAAVSSSRVAGSTKPTKAVEAGSFADKHESQTASKKQTAAVNVRPPAPKNSSTNNHSNKKAAKAPTTATTIPSATGANPGVKKTTITTTKKKKVPATKKKTPTANNDTNKATTPMHNVNARRPSAPAVTVTIHKPPAAASLRPTTQAPTLKFPTEDNYEQPPSLPLNRMAIGFDNRFLETDICRSTGQEYIDECHVFLESLSVRGATPCIIATSTAKEKGTRIRDARRRNAVAVQAHATTGSGNSTALQPVWIAPPTNHNNKVNRQAVYVPRPLSANDSWKHFGEMGELY